jgi:hypothetical protein
MAARPPGEPGDFWHRRDGLAPDNLMRRLRWLVPHPFRPSSRLSLFP